MANIFEGIYHTVEGLIQSIFAIIESIFHVVYAFVHGVFSLVWNTLEGVAEFLGASVHFVLSNIVILGLLVLGYIIYNDRNKPGTVGNNLKKKAQ